jgi:hypothetical protein
VVVIACLKARATPVALVTGDAAVSLEYRFADAATRARLRADLEEAFRAFERTHDR